MFSLQGNERAHAWGAFMVGVASVLWVVVLWLSSVQGWFLIPFFGIAAVIYGVRAVRRQSDLTGRALAVVGASLGALVLALCVLIVVWLALHPLE